MGPARFSSTSDCGRWTRTAIPSVVLFWAIVMTVSIAQTSDPADDVLALHLRWLGGRAALERLRDLEWKGELTIAGLNGPIELTETRDGWRRRHTELGPLLTTDVIGPTGAWVVNLSGQLEPMDAATRETERQDNLRTFGRHLLRAGDVHDLGREDRDGRSWRVKGFTFPNGDRFELFLDPVDGSCTWIRERQGEDVFWTRLGDWRMVAGVRLPFEQRAIHEDNPRRDSTIRWVS